MALDWNALERLVVATEARELDCEAALREIPALLESLEDRSDPPCAELQAHLVRCGCCREELRALVRALKGCAA